MPERIGQLIIDGNHESESVSRDRVLFAPKLLPAGFIFLDDYPATYPGVVEATEEFVAEAPGYELMHQSYFAILRRRNRSASCGPIFYDAGFRFVDKLPGLKLRGHQPRPIDSRPPSDTGHKLLARFYDSTQ